MPSSWMPLSLSAYERPSTYVVNVNIDSKLSLITMHMDVTVIGEANFVGKPGKR